MNSAFREVPSSSQALRLSDFEPQSYIASEEYTAPHLRSLKSAYSRVCSHSSPNFQPSLQFPVLPSKNSIPFCDVCSQRNGSKDFAFCSVCQTAVHRACYGGVLLYKNVWTLWVCDRCLICGLQDLSPMSTSCVLCNLSLGAVKWTPGFGWVHPGCVIYSDSVKFRGPDQSEIVVFGRIPRAKLCGFCYKFSQWCVKCEQTDCEAFFHWKCAQIEGVRPFVYGTVTHLYCESHRNLFFGPDPESHFLRNQYQSRVWKRKVDMKKPTFAVEDGLSLGSSEGTGAEKEEIQSLISSETGSSDDLKTVLPLSRSVLGSVERYRKQEIKVIFKSERRMLTSDLAKITGIRTVGTCTELETELKQYLRRHKRRQNCDFYDISHMPELAKLLGVDGKVEHKGVPRLILQNSVLLNM